MNAYHNNNNNDVDVTDEQDTDADIDIYDGDDEVENNEDKKAISEKSTNMDVTQMLNFFYYPAECIYDEKTQQTEVKIQCVNDALYNIRQRIKDDKLIKLVVASDPDLKKFANEVITFSAATVDATQLTNRLIYTLISCKSSLLPSAKILKLNCNGSVQCPYPHLYMHYETEHERKDAINFFKALKKHQFVPQDTELMIENGRAIIPSIDWYGVAQTAQLHLSPEKQQSMFEELHAMTKIIGKYGEKNSQDPILQHLTELNSTLTQHVTTYSNNAQRNVLVFKKRLVATVQNSAFVRTLQQHHGEQYEKHRGILQGILRVVVFVGTSLFSGIKKKLLPCFLDTSQEKGRKIAKEMQKGMEKIFSSDADHSKDMSVRKTAFAVKGRY